MLVPNYTIWDEFKVHMGLGSGKVSLNSRVMVSVNPIHFIIKSKVDIPPVWKMYGSVLLQMTSRRLALGFGLSDGLLDE